MIGCLVMAFYLCNPNYAPGYGGYGYAQSYSQGYGYAQSGGYYVQPVAQPVYVVPQPVYVAQPVYVGGGYGGYQRPFGYGGGGVGVAVGPRGGVAVRLGY